MRSLVGTAGGESTTAFLLPQLVTGAHGGLVGGYVNSVVNVLEELQLVRKVVLVAGVADPAAWERAALADRLPNVAFAGIRMMSAPTSSRYFAEFAVKALGAIRTIPMGIVYGHSGHAAYSAVTAAAGRVAGAASAHALYCPVTEEFQHRQVGTVARVVSRRGLRSVGSIVAISRNVATSIQQMLGTSVQVDVIPPAIPASFASGEITRRAVGGRLVVGFVGHHRPEKGLDIALAALASFRQEREIELLAVMSGEESRRANDEVRQLLRDHGVDRAVKVMHGITDIRDFYAAIDLLLVPFRNTRGPSDYPLVLLEAFARGVPAVCTPVGAIPEVIEDGRNGFIAERVDASSYARALLRAVTALSTHGKGLTERVREAADPFRASAVAARTDTHLAKVEGRRT